MSSFVIRFLPALQHIQAFHNTVATKSCGTDFVQPGAKAPTMPSSPIPATDYTTFMEDIVKTTVATAV
jgi:hypothetical protein